MSKRLSELLRQRTQIQEHLTWLDREIAAEQGTLPSTDPVKAGSATPAMSLPTSDSPPPLPSSEFEATAKKIIGEYQQDLGALGQNTRRGCLWFFSIALGAGVVMAAIAYVLYARHLGRWW